MSLTLPSNMPNLVGILFGAECNLTASVLAEMLAQGFALSAVVLSGPPGMKSPLLSPPPERNLPILPSPASVHTVTQIADARQVPVYRIGDLRSSESLDLVTNSRADYLLSVCFPRRIPSLIRDAVPGPALNLHPSRLPKLRGPDPVFWTFHAGNGRGGLTLHELSHTLDAGNIAAQRELDIPDGTTEGKLEARIGSLGVDMLSEVLASVASARYKSRQQDHTQATYAPLPAGEDYALNTAWSTRRGFNFVRGVVGRGEPISVEAARGLARVLSVSGFGQNPAVPDNHTLIEMADGYLVARIGAMPD